MLNQNNFYDIESIGGNMVEKVEIRACTFFEQTALLLGNSE